jgi:hypothetical protein
MEQHSRRHAPGQDQQQDDEIADVSMHGLPVAEPIEITYVHAEGADDRDMDEKHAHHGDDDLSTMEAGGSITCDRANSTFSAQQSHHSELPKHNKSSAFRLFSVRRPHMRAFHMAWIRSVPLPSPLFKPCLLIMHAYVAQISL